MKAKVGPRIVRSAVQPPSVGRATRERRRWLRDAREQEAQKFQYCRTERERLGEL